MINQKNDEKVAQAQFSFIPEPIRAKVKLADNAGTIQISFSRSVKLNIDDFDAADLTDD